jgi:hypothetical protein
MRSNSVVAKRGSTQPHFALLLSLGILAGPLAVPAAISVGPSGSTNAFTSQPAASEWSTYSFTGAGGDSYDLTNLVQGMAAGSISAALVGSAADPPANNGLALWTSGGGGYICTAPTGNRCTLLMAALVNNTGTNLTSLRVRYDLAIKNPATELEYRGLRAFYSTTGVTGSWIPIPEFSSANPAAGSLTANILLGTPWAQSGYLYLLWADDNSSSITDPVYAIDNFSVGAGAGLWVSLTSPTAGQSFAAPGTVTLQASPATPSGSITGVGFFVSNSGWLASALSSPYATQVSGLGAGTYGVYAVVTNSLGQTAFSATNVITVVSSSSGWTAYNDYARGSGTAANVSTWSITASSQTVGGPLIDFVTGLSVPAGVAITAGTINQANGSSVAPNTGTPADQLFTGKVDWSGSALSFAPAGSYDATVVYTFTNLTAGRTYSFRGVCQRGSTYPGRWTLVTLAGTSSATPAHKTGSGSPGIVTNGWAPYGSSLSAKTQAAVNAGANLCGDVVGWDDIVPSGTSFSITCANWHASLGAGAAVPGGTIEDTYTYALSAFALSESAAAGPPQLTTALSGSVTNGVGLPQTFSVGSAGSYPLVYFWTNGTTLVAVRTNDNTYTIPALALSDSGTVWSVGITNAYGKTNGGRVTLYVTNTFLSVSLTSPANGAALSSPAAVAYQAAPNAGSGGGSIASVTFYMISNGVKMLLFTDTTAPYSNQVTGLPDGSYGFFAVVTNSLNATAVSATNFVNVASVVSGTLTRGPYLGSRGTTNIVVRWRTAESTQGRVRFGTSPGDLSSYADDTATSTDHRVFLTGLLPETKYYYSLGVAAGTVQSSTNYFFSTAPVTGLARPTRVLFMSDFGNVDSTQTAVRDAYLNLMRTNGRATDVWLGGGDNEQADSGGDTYYQADVFNIYGSILQNTPFQPAPGNHDGGSSSAYWSIFSLPINGECGGVASGSQHYYSFDYGNVHFISLDAYNNGNGISAGSAILTWLQRDLADTTQPWIIAYWHQPPYCQNYYNSDTDSILKATRENFNPILEAYGVDLVMNGHCHDLQRTFLINKFYGTMSTWNATNKIAGGNGRMDGDGPYYKTGSAGAVYATAPSGCGLNHVGSANGSCWATVLSYTIHGCLVIDVNSNRLDFKCMASDGSIPDYFTILKDSGQSLFPRVASVDPPAGFVAALTNITVSFDEAVGGVNASDLLVNGVPAGSVTGGSSNTTYTFTFPQPACGPVAITWASSPGITDFDLVPKAFNPTASGATWQYELMNPNAPRIISQTPAPGALVSNLTSVTVVFSTVVTGVEVGDILINGVPATNMMGDEDVYTFGFPQPPNGTVTITWVTNHVIRDFFNPSLTFNPAAPGGTWTYTFSDEGLYPEVSSVDPPAGYVYALTNITVTFSEAVTGVEATDLLVNGVPASSVTGGASNTTYTFRVAQPAYGPVAITWVAGAGITDFDPTPRAFDTSGPGAVWEYELLNPNAPRIIAQIPAPGALLSNLTSITVVFNEALRGVEISDFLINGVPATNMAGDEETYVFTFPQPANGTVTLSWVTNHVILDWNDPPLSFNPAAPGGTWTYTLSDLVAPAVAAQDPPAGANVANLRKITVVFSETVIAVKASDLLINGLSATNVVGSGTTYTFGLAPPAGTNISVSWAQNVAIKDGAYPPNSFSRNGPGASWSYQNLPPDLTVHQAGTNVTVSWPTNVLGYQFQSATVLAPVPDWQTITNGITSGGRVNSFKLTPSPAVPARYYRLKSN